LKYTSGATTTACQPPPWASRRSPTRTAKQNGSASTQSPPGPRPSQNNPATTRSIAPSPHTTHSARQIHPPHHTLAMQSRCTAPASSSPTATKALVCWVLWVLQKFIQAYIGSGYLIDECGLQTQPFMFFYEIKDFRE